MLNVVCPHVIFHLAGYAYAAGSVDEPVCDMNGNLVSTFELLEALRSIRFSGLLVYASSAAVYGEPQSLPMTEEHPTHPISPYGVSKLAAERYVSVYSSLYHIPAVAVRSFSIYGPRQRKQVVYDLITKMRNHAPATLLGDGTQIRDLIYISDAVEAMLLTARRGLPDGSVYNLCSGMGTSIKQLAEEVSEILHVNTSIQFSGERRGGDPECWIGSSAKIESLGFTPEVSLSEGLRRTIDWHLKYSHGGPLQGEVSKC
jgi:UDP-glucose 4-epimerase